MDGLTEVANLLVVECLARQGTMELGGYVT
jgi:hypothetical protein